MESYYGVDNNANVSAAVSMLNGLLPAPDVVLCTGDLTNYGQREEYVALRDLLSPLEAPFYVIPGNHDDARHLREVLGEHDYLASGRRFLCYVIDGYPLRLVGFDSTLAGSHNGAICSERLEWLRSVLEAEPERPTLLFMHHPPFETGIWWMDGMGIVEGVDELRDLLDKHPQVRRIACGHMHRVIQANLGRTPVSVCPSTTYQVCLDTVPESPPKFIAEAAGAAASPLDRRSPREPHRVLQLSRRADRPPTRDHGLGRPIRADPRRTADSEDLNARLPARAGPTARASRVVRTRRLHFGHLVTCTQRHARNPAPVDTDTRSSKRSRHCESQVAHPRSRRPLVRPAT